VTCHSASAPDAAIVEPGGQRAVVEAAQRFCAAGRAFALTLVVTAEGSTYRKPGALALVADDGRQVGVISGGCLEPGLVTLAQRALAAGQPLDTVFDTRSDDDLVFGSGSGCRGRMRVLAVPVRPGTPSPVLDAVLSAHESRHPARLALDAIAPGLGLDGEVTVRPPPLVLLAGAGPEAPPLLSIARTLGWVAWVADHRPGLLDTGRVRCADRVIVERPAPALAALHGATLDAAIVMTHSAEHDLAALAALADRDVGYVGLLGPRERRDELLGRLTPEQRAALDGRLRAPVGLKLGGEGPEAIALAIAAEMQQAFSAPEARRPR
jgi:xanthine dehydrogenase accessory factor